MSRIGDGTVIRSVLPGEHHLEIFGAVIRSIAIQVVYYLIAAKRPSQGVLRYQTVLKGITFAICRGMRRLEDFDIAVRTRLATIPTIMALAAERVMMIKISPTVAGMDVPNPARRETRRHLPSTTATADCAGQNPWGRTIDFPPPRRARKVLMLRQIANAFPLLAGVKEKQLSTATSTGGFYDWPSRLHALRIPQ